MKKRKKHFLVLLVVALLSADVVFAQDAPIPPQAPARVPFSAFRMKPILTPQTPEQNTSLVVQDVPVKKPARTLKIRDGNSEGAITQIRPVTKPEAQDDIIFSPQIDAPSVPIQSTMGPLVIPRPARKPQQVQAAPEVKTIERVQAQVVETVEILKDLPAPPKEPEPEQAQPQTAAKSPAIIVPLAKPDFGNNAPSVRIRDPDRFSSQRRMGGNNESQSNNFGSLGLPSDMQNLNIGKLKQGKGVSPVLMPGRSATMAAPDKERTDEKGLPSEVIVFFQESSTDLEVGQLDILNNDVVAMLKNQPNLSLEIVGFAEQEAGGSEAVRKRSLARALMIRQYLIKQGIDGNRLTVEGKGDDTKIDPRDRVEMYFDR